MAASMKKQGLTVPTSTPIPAGIGRAVTASNPAINPKDAPGYNPVNDPTSSVYKQSQSGTPPPTPTGTTPEVPIDPNAPSTPEMRAQVDNARQTVENLAQQRGVKLQQNAQGKYSTVPDLGAQMKKGLDLAQQSNQPAPQDAGAGSALVDSTLSSFAPPPESPSLLGGMMEVDSNFDSIFTMFDDFMSPVKQRESLLSEYQTMSKSLGIEQMNEELVDAKRIIEGTEDDIRAEVTATGGFASESQVLALANARNKSLIKNYNYLLESRDNAMTQLGTMMDLSIQDRKFAEAEFDRKMDFGMKVMEFKQKATDNARTGLKWAIENGAGSEILKSPYETSLVEKTLGLTSGSLAGIVSKQAQETNLEAKYKQAQIDNIYSQIGERNASGNVIVDQSGKVLLKAEEGRKLNKELVNSDAFKSMNKAQDSLQFLNNFEKSFEKFGATSAVFDPIKNSKMKAEYNAAILNLKEFFNLGVLNGPDEAILRGVLPDPTNRSNALRAVSFGIYNPAKATENGLKSMKEMVETTLDDRFRTVMASYGDYSTQSVGAVGDTMRKYVDAKATLNPEVKKMLDENPDLSYEEVIEIITQ